MRRPPVELCRMLTAARSSGLTFDDAWPECVSAALACVKSQEREEWRAALEGLEPLWRSAYLRRPHRALQVLSAEMALDAA